MAEVPVQVEGVAVAPEAAVVKGRVKRDNPLLETLGQPIHQYTVSNGGYDYASLN